MNKLHDPIRATNTHHEHVSQATLAERKMMNIAWGIVGVKNQKPRLLNGEDAV